MIRNIRLNTKTKQIIQSVYPTMSSLQQSIADYFLENTELLRYSMSLNQPYQDLHKSVTLKVIVSSFMNTAATFKTAK